MKVVLALAMVVVALACTAIAAVLFAKHRAENALVSEEVVVRASWPGASALGLETDVTDRLEAELNALPGLTSLRSTSGSDGEATLWLRFERRAIEPERVLAVFPAVEQARRSLPSEANVAVLRRWPGAHEERWVLRSATASPDVVGAWVTKTVVPELQRTPGVQEVTVCGAAEPELVVQLDEARLQAMQVAVSEVVTTLRLADLLRTPESVADVALKDGVRLRDVAVVSRAIAPRTCLAFEDGQPAVVVTVRREGAEPLKFPAGGPDVQVHRVEATVDSRWQTPPPLEGIDPTPGRALSSPGLVAMAEAGQVRVLGARLPEAPTGATLVGIEGRRTVLRFQGSELEGLSRAATDTAKALSAAGGGWVGAVTPGVRPDIELKVDRDRAAMLGVPMADIAEAIRLSMGGVVIPTGLGIESSIPMRVKAGSLETARVKGIPLAELLSRQATIGPEAIHRLERQRLVTVETALDEATVKRLLPSLQPGVRCTVTMEGAPLASAPR